jgi:hypothetical protein
MDEVRAALERVLFFFYEGFRPTPERIASYGGGWVAEEALAIGVWCALFARSLEEGIVMAVNHDGDSVSTGVITGQLLGVQYGAAAIPSRWCRGISAGCRVSLMQSFLATIRAIDHAGIARMLSVVFLRPSNF